MASRLRAVPDPAGPAWCRTAGCPFPARPALGYCAPCEAVHVAARQLRERLLDRRVARLTPSHQALVGALSPPVRERLLTHMAARAQPALDMAILEDFFAELVELGLSSEGPA